VFVSQELLYKVAYDEAVRALSEQRVAIDNFRARAGLLFSAAVVTTSFLGSQVLRVDDRGVFTGLALLAFVAMASVSLAILWPRNWDVTANPRELIETFMEKADNAQVEELHRDLSLHMHNSYLENRQGVEQLALLFEAAAALVAGEVVLWIAAIASTM
jgi:hypothetical protein